MTNYKEPDEHKEYLHCHTIIYKTEDDDGNFKYSTTKYEHNHSWMCNIDYDQLDEINSDFKVSFERKMSREKYSRNLD